MHKNAEYNVTEEDFHIIC